MSRPSERRRSPASRRTASGPRRAAGRGRRRPPRGRRSAARTERPARRSACGRSGRSRSSHRAPGCPRACSSSGRPRPPPRACRARLGASPSRCDCRYGSCGPPTSGPSSQSMPSQRSVSTSRAISSGFALSGSVSSTRHTNAPPSCRANSQLNSSVRMLPMWMSPLGAPAYRTRTPLTPSGRDSQHADAFELDLDVVAVGERRDAGRRPGEDHVARAGAS